MSVSLLPVVVGLAAGLAMRHSCADGSFNLASAGVALVIVFGVACSGMRHKLLFDERLKREAAATYDSTLAYAQGVVPVAAKRVRADTELRRFMFKNQVSVIGRITPMPDDGQPDEYWKERNFIHLHWIAAGRIILVGQQGVDRTIADASSVLGDNIYLDKIVPVISRDYAVTDVDLLRFRRYELPFLEQMKDGKITADDFEQPLIQAVASRVDWLTFATNGFEPFLAIAMFWGSVIIYKLVRQDSDTETV